MRAFELFSGLGGMHMALKESGVVFEVVAALDINTTANEVYKFNFPQTKVMQNNVQCLTVKLITEMKIEFISMSPPCQPYTRQGHQKGSEDNRSDALKHIMSLIPDLTTVQYILLENVVGFESSSTRDQLTEVLASSGFHFQEFILCPSQFGIPNSRKRYYLLARKNKTFNLASSNNILYELSKVDDEKFEKLIVKFHKFRIKNILDDNRSSILPDKVLLKYAMILDIVTENSDRSCCFTKGYAHYTEGTGSVFCPFSQEKIDDVYRNIKEINKMSDEYLNELKKLEMRYFSPIEVCRLMCFSENFEFPKTVSTKQMYRLLGNSVNVHVISILIKLLIDS